MYGKKFFIYTFTPVSSCFLASLLAFLQPTGSGEGYGDLTGRTFDLTLMLESASANARGGVWMGMDIQKNIFLMLMLRSW